MTAAGRPKGATGAIELGSSAKLSGLISKRPSRWASEQRARLVDAWPVLLAGVVLLAGMIAGEVLVGDRLLIASPAASASALAATGVAGICFAVVASAKFRTYSKVRWAWIAVGSLTLGVILLFALVTGILRSPTFANGPGLGRLDLLGEAAQVSFLVGVAMAFTFAGRIQVSFTEGSAIAAAVGLTAGGIGLTALPVSAYRTLSTILDLLQMVLAIGCLLAILFGPKGPKNTMRTWLGFAVIELLAVSLPFPVRLSEYTRAGLGLGEIYVSLAMVLLMVGGFRSIFSDFHQLDRVNGDLRRVNLEQAAANTRLVSMAQEVKVAARARRTFLGMVSHELRTPLNTVSGFSQLLAADPSIGEKQRRQVAHILDGAARLSERVEDILALTAVASLPELPGPLSIDAQILLKPFARLAESLAISKGSS